MANNIPTQIRTIDSFASYNSNVVNRLTRVITHGVNCISTARVVDITLDSTSSVIVSTGRCYKDDVMIEITEDFNVNLELGDFYNTTPYFNEAGYYYLTLNYNYVKAKPAPQAEILILKPSQRSSFNEESLLFLKCIYVIFNGLSFEIDSITDYDPENPDVHRIYTDTFCGMYDSLYTYDLDVDYAKIIYVRDQDDLYWGGRSSWRKIGELQYVFDSSLCEIGQLGYIGTDLKIYPAISTDILTFSECVIVDDDKIQINGECTVKIEPGIIIQNGEKLYLSETDEGTVTNVEPETAQLIGIAITDGTSTCRVLINSLGKISNSISNEITSISNNVRQLAVDSFGTSYLLSEQTGGSDRTIGICANNQGTPNLGAYRTWYTSSAGAFITNFLGCQQDAIRYIIFVNDKTTIQYNSVLQLSGGENITGETGKVLTLIFNNGVWKEVSYSPDPRSSFPRKVSDIISGNDWVEGTQSDTYVIDISDFGNKDVIVNCYNDEDKKFMVQNIILYTENETLLQMPQDTTGVITAVVSLADYSNTIETTSWVSSGGLYYYDITLETLDSTSCIIACYDEYTAKQIIPYDIEILNINTIRIWMPINTVRMLVLIDEANVVQEILEGQPYSSDYPPEQTSTYVKSTSLYSTDYHPYYSTDPAKELTGVSEGNAWRSANASYNEQRFHIDLGSGKIITRIYYENGHESGAATNQGAKTFTVWGSNSGSSFADTDYHTDFGWTSIEPSQVTFDEHFASDVEDPKYIYLTNSDSFRYYAIKIEDNWGSTDYMSIRRIELQEDDDESGDWTISGLEYYYDINISSIDSTSMITYFYDNTTNKTIIPTEVEIISSDILRIWMTEPLGITCLIDSLNNIVQEITLSDQLSVLPYYGLVDISEINSEDVVITCYNNITKRVQPFSDTFNVEVLNSTRLKVWSSTTLYPIRVVVVG
jgi:hypothetical protein